MIAPPSSVIHPRQDKQDRRSDELDNPSSTSNGEKPFFCGIDAFECEQFVHIVRERAFAEGRQRDNDWIIDFATSCFVGDALRWHAALDDDIRSNWNLLEKAMLFRYRRPFSGSGGEECEEFISAVRHYAFELGKQRDNQWIADFASTAFSGDALRWFMTLDVTVQGDWRLLAKALLEKYSSLPESPRVHRRTTLPSAMIPTPAAAAPTLPRTTALTPQRPILGTIHVLVENEPERNGLLSRFLNPYGWHVPTQSPEDAIRVSAIPFGKYVKMKFINSPTSFDWLGLTWNRPRPIEPANHLAPDAIFSAVARPFAAVAKSTSKSYEGHTEVALWDIASDGRMTLIWSDEKAVLWDLSIRINSADVLFVASRQHCKVAEGHRVVRLAFVPE